MSGVSLHVDLRDLQRVQARIDHLASFDRMGLAEAIAGELESQTRRRIQDEKAAPDGTPWQPWSERYAATRHGGHSLLQGENDLLDSIDSLVSEDAIETGSNLIYAAHQNYGGEDIGSGVPARQFVGLSDENLDDVEDVSITFIDRYLESAA